MLLLSRPNPRAAEDEDAVGRVLLLAYARRVVPEPVAAVLRGTYRRAGDPLKWKASQDGLADFPDDYQRFVRDLTTDFRDFAKRGVSALMWRAGAFGGPVELRRSCFDVRWQPAGDEIDFVDSPYLANHLPHGVFEVGFPFLTTELAEINEQVRDDAEAIVCAGGDQPLYHDLLREATADRYERRRASLVLCVAAIETGLKTLIADLQPDTAWLLENLPSPPVVKLLRELLPTLPTRNNFGGEVLRPTKKVITVVRDAVELRNLLVHGRAREVPKETLDQILATAQGLLYLFDFYRGEKWASQFIGEVVEDKQRTGV